VRLAGQLRIDRAQALRGYEQQRRGVAAPRREERDLRPEQAGPCLIELAQQPRLGRRDQAQGVVERSGLELRLGGRERAPRPP
jgi:hypothetical protein